MARKIIKSKHFFEEDFIESLAEVPEKAVQPWPAEKITRVVGQPITRIDAYDKVSGSAVYTTDVSLPNMAHARTLRCPHPHARIKRIDTSSASKLPGVLAIITHRNSGDISWYGGTSKLFDPHLRFEGDEVACVAAETEVIADEALGLISVEYQVLPHVSSAEEALKATAPRLYPEGNMRNGKPNIYRRGDIKNGFAEADVVIEDTFTTQVEVHHPTEPHSSVVNWDGDRLTVWDSTQGVFRIRDMVAEALQLPASHVRVLKKYMGGGFGSKLTAGKYTVMAALLARRIGRPVRIVLDRREMSLAVGNRPDSHQTLKVGARKDGTLTAISHHSFGAIGAYPSSAACSWPARTMYRCPNVYSEDISAYINAGPGRPFRAPGHVQGTFALDSIMDAMAEKLNMDPLEFRLKNYAEKDQVFNLPYTSKLLREAYRKGAEAIGWHTRRKPPGSDPGPVKHGIGMASQIWWGGGGPPAYATLKMNRDLSVQVIAGTQDLGTGTYTILAQVAAEILEIPIDKISVIIGDTAASPYCGSSGGSTTAASVAPAVRDAAEQMKAKLISGAAAILDLSEDRVQYAGGILSDRENPGNQLPASQVIRKMRERVLIATGARGMNPEGYAINSFGAQFAEVAVNTVTGQVRVLKVVAAHDIGRVLNRQTLENQFHGGIIQGIGFALMENRVIDRNTGKVLTTNLHDYKIPTLGATPDIEVIIVSQGDPLINNLGVKGIGEPAMIPTPAAIANAVYNAIGVRIKSLPITPDKVLKALYASQPEPKN